MKPKLQRWIVLWAILLAAAGQGQSQGIIVEGNCVGGSSTFFHLGQDPNGYASFLSGAASYLISFNAASTRWEITDFQLGNLYYYMEADSKPNPLDLASATANNTPWLGLDGCELTSITGSSTQTGLSPRTVLANDGSCLQGITLTEAGVANSKPFFTAPNSAYVLSWNLDGPYWRITRNEPTGAVVLYTNTLDTPLPPEAASADAAGNPWVDVDGCGQGLSVTGTGTQNIEPPINRVWSPLGEGTSNGINGRVDDLALDANGNLYVAGQFNEAGGQPVSHIAVWDGSSWSAVGDPQDGGFDDRIWSIAIDDASGKVYVGGSFSTVDGATANGVAVWDGASWSPLGTGVQPGRNVYAIELDENGNLFAGGDFQEAGGVQVRRIAKWDGASWSALNGGFVGGRVGDMEFDQAGDLYIAGSFTAALSEVTTTFVPNTRGLVKWDGVNWASIGGSLANEATAIAFDNSGNLFATGSFAWAGNSFNTVNQVAKWDGNAWSGLGQGLNGIGTELEIDNSNNVYVSGFFNQAGGESALKLAKWDGSAWSTIVPNGNNGQQYALATDASDNLYAGGDFSWIDQVPANDIAFYGPPPPCSLEITNVSVTDVSCLGETDGSITITAACENCEGAIMYSIDGGETLQASNVFSGLAADSTAYTPYVEEAGNSNCADTGAEAFVNTQADNIAPTANCPADITVGTAPGACNNTVAFTIPEPTDNCPGATASADLNSGDVYGVGAYTVTVTAIDAANNPGMCTFTITVNDTEAPMVTCPTNASISCTDSTEPSATGFAIATDNCTAQPSLSVNDVVTPGVCPGAYTIARTFNAIDEAGLQSSCTQTITVLDTEAPAIVCPADIEVGCGDSTEPAFTGMATATDNCTAEPVIDYIDASEGNSGGQQVLATITRQWRAQDECGNLLSCFQTVTIADREAPQMACQDITVPLSGPSASFTPEQIDNGSTDNCSLSSLELSSSTVTCANLGGTGVQAVILIGTDASGNTASCQASVTVQDINPPTAICRDVTVNLTSDGTTLIGPAFLDGGSSAVCGSLTYLTPLLSFSCSDVGNTLPINLTVGTTTNGLSATCTSNVTVADPQSYCCAPATAFCSDATVTLSPDGTGQLLPAQVGGNSLAECGLAAETLSKVLFSCDDIGTQAVTYTITDVNGASDFCTANVTIVEGTALPSPWYQTGVGNAPGSQSEYTPCTGQDDEIVLQSNGLNPINGTSDNLGTALQSICGDVEITARITNIVDAYAGLLIREDTSPGSRYIGLYTAGSPLYRRESRAVPNGAKQAAIYMGSTTGWMRIQRQGNLFRLYRSTNGVQFQLLTQTVIPMGECVEAGLAIFGYRPGRTASATVTDISITGGGSGSALSGAASAPQAHRPKAGQAIDAPGMLIENLSSIAGNLSPAVYPNPSRGQFTLSLPEPLSTAAIALLKDQLGRTVAQRRLQPGQHQAQWDANELSAGLYLLHLQGTDLPPIRVMIE